LRFPGPARAVDAAEDLSVCFNAVSDDPAVAMRANRRQRVYRALETVGGVVFSAYDSSNALSYSFSQTSHVAIHKSFTRRGLRGGGQLIFTNRNRRLWILFLV